VPHGGGQAASIRSPTTIVCSSAGFPKGCRTVKRPIPTLTRIEVLPKQRTMRLNGDQQLVVLAHYSDNSVLDVTRSAPLRAERKEHGQDRGRRSSSRCFDQPGDVAVMVRYQARVAVFPRQPCRSARWWTISRRRVIISTSRSSRS